MTTTESEFFRGFADRVRTTVADTPKGDTAVNTTQPLYGTAADQVRDQLAAVPATFQADPDAPCTVHPWCVETGAHIDHMGRRVAMKNRDGAELLAAFLYTDEPTGLPELCFDPGTDDWREHDHGDLLRKYTAQVRTHLARLDAFADEFDAIREAAGETVEESTLRPELITRVEVEAATLSEGSVLLFKQYGDLLKVAFDPDRITEEKARELVASRVGPEAAAVIDPATEGPAARTWSITTELGVKVGGYLPPWAENDPSLDNVPADRLQLHLSDLTFIRDYPGPLMTVDAPFGEDGKREVAENEVFRAQIWCAPHDADRPEEREPYGLVTVLPDCVIDHLGPDDLAGIAAKLREQADRIAQAAVDLTAAQADWAKNGGTR